MFQNPSTTYLFQKEYDPIETGNCIFFSICYLIKCVQFQKKNDYLGDVRGIVQEVYYLWEEYLMVKQCAICLTPKGSLQMPQDCTAFYKKILSEIVLMDFELNPYGMCISIANCHLHYFTMWWWLNCCYQQSG